MIIHSQITRYFQTRASTKLIDQTPTKIELKVILMRVLENIDRVMKDSYIPVFPHPFMVRLKLQSY